MGLFLYLFLWLGLMIFWVLLGARCMLALAEVLGCAMCNLVVLFLPGLEMNPGLLMPLTVCS
jgi:hypothetical protein